MDGSETGRKGILAILQDSCLRKVDWESFLDDAMNSSPVEFNRYLQYCRETKLKI